MDEVHRFESPEVGVVRDPAAADPGDIVVGEDDIDAEAAGLEGVLEIRPGADPGAGDDVGVRADVLEEPLLGQDLRPEHGLRVAVVVAEAHADLGDEEAVGDGRDDGDAVGPLEPPGLFDALAPGGQLVDGDADLDHGMARAALAAGHGGLCALVPDPSDAGIGRRRRSRPCWSTRTPRRWRPCRRPGTSARVLGGRVYWSPGLSTISCQTVRKGLYVLGTRAFGFGVRSPGDVEVDLAVAAAERLLLSRIPAVDSRMAVLGTDLPGQEDQLFGAVAVVVLVDDDLEPHALEVAEAEVGDFHRLELAPGDGDAGLAQQDDRRGFR